jgi:dipeptidyl aminopeptidase/acylaminoacyl peptidase
MFRQQRDPARAYSEPSYFYSTLIFPLMPIQSPRVKSAQSIAAALLSAVLAASSLAQSPASASRDAFVKPNPNLHIENIPPIPQSLADAMAKYSDFRSHSFVAWHPKKVEMIVSHREQGASTAQLYWVKSPMGKEMPITRHPDPVGSATIEPSEGKYIVFQSSKGGSEQDQLFRQDKDGEPAVQLTDSKMRHSRGPWRRIHGKPTGEMLVSSVPLDRNMTEEQKKSPSTTFRLLDPLAPEKARTIAEIPGTGWFSGAFNPVGDTLLVTRYISANESEVWTMNVADGKRERVLPVDEKAKAVHLGGRFSRDGKGIYLVSDRKGEFLELMYFELANQSLTSLTRGLPHDTSGASEDDEDSDSRMIYTRMNVKGRSELRAFDSATRKEVALKGVPDGSVVSVVPRRGSTTLALTMNSSRSFGDIYAYDSKTAQTTQWTRAASPMDTSHFKAQEIITWKSFDGLEISGLINRPAAKFTGKRPVVINIHGGPEAQATIGFQGRSNYWLDELGVVVIQPNVRGSSGFGKTFLARDNGMKREDSVKDIGALLDWIATQPDLDASRVLVMGGSYGGYMSLAVSTNYADRIAGAIDVVGISHFVTFLETTESYRRDLRRVEYGDERDPKMREFLNSISPLTNAHKIKKPLLVVQGKNDPRVPYTEAEQIVAKARGNGAPVWYLRAENEGHGFARKENADFYSYAMVRFMQETILK